MQALVRVQATVKSKNPIFLYHRRSLHVLIKLKFILLMQYISNLFIKSNSPQILQERDHQMFCKSRRPKTIKIDSCSSSLPFSSPLPLLLQQAPSQLAALKCRNVQEMSSTTASSTPHCWPNYMASTRSFEAKVRSQSAPRQRPESPGVMKRRVSLNEEVGSRASLSGAAVSFKSALVRRLDRSLQLVSREEEARDYCHLVKIW